MEVTTMNNLFLTFIEVNESDRKALIVLVVILLLLFFILGLIGMAIRATMFYQAKRADSFMHDVTVTHVVTSPKEFRVLGRKKNNRLFYRQSIIPFLIGLTGLLVWLIYSGIAGTWSENIFVSFSDLLFTWNWSDPNIYTDFFFLTIIKQWPALTNSPHFVLEHLAAYFEVPLFVTSMVYYLVVTQAYFARMIKIETRSRDVFTKSLDGYKANDVDPSKVPPLPPND